MAEISAKEETDINNGNDMNEPLTKPIKEKKPRPPKTQAQLEQFEKVRLKRAESLKQKSIAKKIEASKLLLEHGIELPSKDEPKIKEELPQAKPKYHQELTPKSDTDDESDDEPPVIIVKKKKKKKQPKTIIIEESDSDEEDVQQHYINKVKEARHFVSQQNKKSLIKVHKKNDIPNYFVD
jgi:predicted DNA-binding protein (UPF0251 family)